MDAMEIEDGTGSIPTNGQDQGEHNVDEQLGKIRYNHCESLSFLCM